MKRHYLTSSPRSPQPEQKTVIGLVFLLIRDRSPLMPSDVIAVPYGGQAEISL